jgi:aryl-alcohol dehydrogenase-like predicted oxidoreductase
MHAVTCATFDPGATVMKVRQLGATGLQVTPIGLGLAALGRPAYMTLGRDADLGADRSVTAVERRCHDMLDASFRAGVRYVDAARSYGLAEQFLASWLKKRRLAPGEMTIGSKWGYTYTGDWQMNAAEHEVKNLSAATLRRQRGESQAALGSYLSLYQIHSATLDSGVLDDPAVLAGLVELRAAGVAIGLTVTGAQQPQTIRRALSARVDGVNPFQVVQATWNLLETSAGDALAEAKAHGWGIIVKEVLANGRLTDRHGDAECASLRAAAAAAGAALDAFAIAACLSQPWVDVVLSGAVDSAQLRSHISALDIRASNIDWPATAEPPADYWHRRSQLRWT